MLEPVTLSVNSNLLAVGLPQGPWTNVLASCSLLATYLQPTYTLLGVWMKSENECSTKGYPEKLPLLGARPGGMGEAIKMGLTPCGLDQLEWLPQVGSDLCGW